VTGSAFLLIPTDDPALSQDWGQLDRATRIARLQRSHADLGARIQQRLAGLELEYLGGVGGWTVRTRTPTDRQALVEKLEGLPVEVAPNDKFFAS
jgi:hypothetical protein